MIQFSSYFHVWATAHKHYLTMWKPLGEKKIPVLNESLQPDALRANGSTYTVALVAA